MVLIKLRLVAHLDFGLEFPMHWSAGCSNHTFVFPLPCPPLALTTYMLKSRWGAHLQGVQFMVTNSSSPSHILAGALGSSSSSSSLSGHPGPLFVRTVMVVKYPNNQGGTKSPAPCRKAISLLARYERRQIRLGEGNMFLV